MLLIILEKNMKAFAYVACFTSFYIIILLSIFYHNRVFDLMSEFNEIKFVLRRSEENVKDPLFGSSSGFNEESCLSRFQAISYRKISLSNPSPSPYLLSKLRDYEALHKRCGPYTKPYNQTLKSINSSNISTATECQYIVWTAIAGLGNRMLSMGSAFLYALLTNRILLVEHEPDMLNLFCEPFPNTSWRLPQDFPLKGEIRKLNPQHPEILQNLIKKETLPSVAYIYLAASKDHVFYCDKKQKLVQKVPWLILRSDEYFIPSFFLIPSFKEELDRMFPDKETVFHFLGRYLFNPSNKAWGIITRFYHTYLLKADERIGMQIRVFNPRSTSFKNLTDQILACSQQKNLLSGVDEKRSIAFPSRTEALLSKSVLIASLYTEFSEEIKTKYWKFPTITGELIGVFQLSHETHQQFGDNSHNLKAWVEMYLLSLSDALITSSKSTFGYVAQSLAGLKPWILTKPEDWIRTTDDQACVPAISMEPCFHVPPKFDCNSEGRVDMGEVVPHIKHCEDQPIGLKLVNNYFNTSSSR